MVARATPAASAKTRPPAAVKVVAAVPAGMIGWATLMLSRQTARVTANKPWGGNIRVEEEVLIFAITSTYHNLHS